MQRWVPWSAGCLQALEQTVPRSLVTVFLGNQAKQFAAMTCSLTFLRDRYRSGTGPGVPEPPYLLQTEILLPLLSEEKGSSGVSDPRTLLASSTPRWWLEFEM